MYTHGTNRTWPQLSLTVASVVAALLRLIALTCPSGYACGTELYWVFAGYLAAKGCGRRDQEIMALAVGMVVRIPWRRELYPEGR